MSIEGKIIVFTGKISQPRHVFQRMVEEHGGIAGGDVSKNTNYLVVGEKPGSKLFRATSLGIQTITEGEFLKLLEEEKEVEGTSLTSAETLKEVQERLLEERYCYFCGRTYNEFKSWPDYDTCILCEVAYEPKCAHCGDTSPTFISDFKIYQCSDCGEWFKAPYVRYAHKVKHLHFWYKKTATEKGTKEECPCGTVLITNKDGTWTKHEPAYIIEQGRKEAHEFAIKEERQWHKRMEKERQQEEEALEFIKSLTPEQRTQIYSQIT